MVSTPIETLLEGKDFSCEAGGNWSSRKRQEIGCMLHTLQHHRDQKGRGQNHQSILGYQKALHGGKRGHLGIPLSSNPTPKLLGVTFDRTLSFGAHV